MPVNLSIKNAPDDVVARLRQRATLNNRSLQGELMAIIELAASETGFCKASDILAEVHRLGVQTPGDSAAVIRADRDGR